MSAAALNKRVALQQRTQGQDETGAPLTTWANVITTGDGKVWASVTDMTGRQYIAAKAGQNSVSTTIRIRWRAGIVAAMRVLHEADVYDIEAPLDRDGRWLDLMCVKGVNNG